MSLESAIAGRIAKAVASMRGLTFMEAIHKKHGLVTAYRVRHTFLFYRKAFLEQCTDEDSKKLFEAYFGRDFPDLTSKNAEKNG